MFGQCKERNSLVLEVLSIPENSWYTQILDTKAS